MSGSGTSASARSAFSARKLVSVRLSPGSSAANTTSAPGSRLSTSYGPTASSAVIRSKIGMTTCTPRMLRGDYDLGEVLLEVLVRRAVLATRQRDALARRALARARVAAEWAAVDGESLPLAPRDVLGRDRHVAIDDAVDAHLARHGEVNPDVVEERARRTSEVVPVVCEPAERAP